MLKLAPFDTAPLFWHAFFPCCLLALFKGPRRLGIVLFGVYVVTTTLAFTLAIPNVGTLYRMRFWPWILLLAVGVAMTATIWEKRKAPCAG
ncbi:MAG: hypothetical protein HGB26_08140 [Desulfobulbaceae bacterium]|nr:hypothetical protein [Desulfobulbaceae bacterium]